MDQSFQLKEHPIPAEVQQRFQKLQSSWKFSLEDFPVQHLLVRSPNWVGDAVMSLPVLAGLLKFFREAEITVLAAKRVAPLFQGLPGVTEVIPYPAGRGKWQVLWDLRGRFDLALTLPNSLESALGLWLVGVPLRVGYAADARRPLLNLAVSGRRSLAGLHMVFYYLGLLRALGEIETFTPPTLVLRDLEMAVAAQLLADASPGSGPWVGLSPGAAYGPAKRWPPERFAALGRDLINEFGARLVLLGGREEAPVAEQVKKGLGLPVLNLVGKTDLRQALGVLSRLKLLITNDSGLMHAAAALDVPLVALFGSTDPAATGPFTDRATLLRHPLPCSPCLQRTCDLGYACLTAIK
ncbi:MAG: lipopolysaccharide heptosyltransferase II, partial [Deltaproteobacteria bacterium]|nr:lipopolysaccharide heptosyltransferase II [Deltaproteobacteria bacterium]